MKFKDLNNSGWTWGKSIGLGKVVGHTLAKQIAIRAENLSICINSARFFQVWHSNIHMVGHKIKPNQNIWDLGDAAK